MSFSAGVIRGVSRLVEHDLSQEHLSATKQSATKSTASFIEHIMKPNTSNDLAIIADLGQIWTADLEILSGHSLLVMMWVANSLLGKRTKNNPT